jgi:glycosyltransferase involved in cell wall biosynthesis
MSEKPKEISVCALTLYPYDLVPGQRYRIEQWESFLKKDGITIDYYAFADKELLQIIPQHGKILSKISGLTKAFARRITHLSVLAKYDVIYLYRAAAMIGPAFIERIIKLSGRPIVFDFDDAIFLTHTNEANKLFSWVKFAKKTDTICRLSSHITVGNSFLADYARKHNPNVTIIPSGVDIDKFKPQPRLPNDKVVVGWTGSSTSQTYLEMFVPMLRQLMLHRPNIEFHVHSDREPNLPDAPYIWHPWTVETEIEEIARFDIGIMPMPDDGWSLGKCAMKALLYMSLGIPAVCTDLGANREVIQHGVNGFLATSEEDWLTQLETLIDNVELRVKLGAAARETVVQNYSMRKCAELFASAVRQSSQP